MWCFFCSSRSRHTSWPRDWSSDECSSDLLTLADDGFLITCQSRLLFTAGRPTLRPCEERPGPPARQRAGTLPRSEERRVGREWRAVRPAHKCKEHTNDGGATNLGKPASEK